MYILRKVSNLKKGDKIIRNLQLPGPSSCKVVKVTTTEKTATLTIDTFTELGYQEIKMCPDDMVNVLIEKYKFIENENA
jgi:hypothetical protein